MNDTHLIKWLALLLVFPLGLALFSKESFRYPCQDPANWDSKQCQKPLCDVTRTCPEHVFKGGRDPRLGLPSDQSPMQQSSAQPTGVCK